MTQPHTRTIGTRAAEVRVTVTLLVVDLWHRLGARLGARLAPIDGGGGGRKPDAGFPVAGRSAATDRARTVGEDFVARTAGTTLQAPTVTAVVSGDGAVLQVDVTGTVVSVLPGIELRVAKRASGAVERPAP